jgi:hypothetical protein
MMAMMKLAGDAELKEAITNVKSAMDKAGVELSAQVRRCLLACMVIWLTCLRRRRSWRCTRISLSVPHPT